jgi:hypothetical protein
MSGRASLATGHILAPEGVTRQQLYVVAHECAHIALHSDPKRRRRPRHIEEHEAESYAHRALTARGIEVPGASTHWARGYVAQCIEVDRANGIPICPMAEAFASGRRSPYASLPAVDAHRRRKPSAPATIGCATCRYRNGRQCTVHLQDHFYAWRSACNGGQSWRPLRRALLARLAGAFMSMISGRRKAQPAKPKKPARTLSEVGAKTKNRR